MTQKVFVLVKCDICNESNDTQVWSFASKEKAQDKLNNLFSIDKNEINEDVRVCDKKDDYYEVYEEGRFNGNSLSAYIYETELN